MDIANLRLQNQGIATTPFERPEDVVHHLAAVQAQDFAGAKWALGLRLKNGADADISLSFAKGAILRTHLLRPTWHFVTPEDIRWLLALTAPRVHAANAYMYRKLELDGTTLKRSSDYVVKALADAKELTRDELRDILHRSDISTGESLRIVYILMYAELEGLICSGDRRGRQFTYALLDDRAPKTKALDRDEALAELAQRYFRSRGPATVHDFSKWSGLTMIDAKHGLGAVKKHLECSRIDDQMYWFSTPISAVTATSPRAYLLSIYDEYTIGYKDRSAIVKGGKAEALVALRNALNYIMVVNGQVVGSWRRTLQRKSVVIEVNPLTQLTIAEQQSVEESAQAYGRFFGLAVELVWRA